MQSYVQSALLLFLLLNPFLLTVYLVDVFAKLEKTKFRSVLVRAALAATVVYCCFAVLGDAIFSRVIQAQFASFQIFGGVVFLLIGLQFVFRGPTSIELLRGESEQLVGAIAMPILIGPGTLSASVVVGQRHHALAACIVVVAAVAVAVTAMLAMKAVHDYVRPRNSRLVDRYIEIAGRITALYVGTVAVEMIMQGVRTWMQLSNGVS